MSQPPIDPFARVLVNKPLFKKKKTTTTMTTTVSSTAAPGVDPRVLFPQVIPKTKAPITNPTLGNSTQPAGGSEEYEICAPFLPCNPMACGEGTVAPVDCPDCNRMATGGTVFGMILLSVLIIIANLLVIRIILRTPSLRRRHGYIKLSMATSDLLIGIFVIPSAVANLVTSLYYPYRHPDDVTDEPTDWLQHVMDLRQKNSTASIIFGTITVISVISSLYNLLLLSADRFLAIARPLKHRTGKYFPKKSLWLSIAAVWIFGVVLSIVPAFFPAHFSYVMDLTTFVFIQQLGPSEATEGSDFGFSPYYIIVVIGGPYFITVVLNILTTIFTWKSLKMRARMSSRKQLSKSAIEKKCERNRRMQMLKKAYPEAVEEDEGSSTFKSIFKKGTPRHDVPKKHKRHHDVTGMTPSGAAKEKESWLVWWHSNDDIPDANASASNNVSTDSDRSQSSQSPRFQRTRDQLHIVRDVLNPTNVRNRAREFKETHKTHVHVLRMIIAMVVTFTLCLMPYVIVTAKVADGKLDCANMAVPFTFAIYMLFINSGMNFVIYNLWHPEFRRHLMKTFRSDYTRTTSWRRAASGFFMTSQKSTDSSMTYATRTHSVDDALN